MLVGRLTYDAVKQRQKSTGDLSPRRIPHSSEFMSLKNQINERPLKSISNDLSFKGLSFTGDNSQQKEAGKKPSSLAPSLALFGTIAGIGLALRFARSYKEAGKPYSINKFREFSRTYLGMKKSTGGAVETSIGEELLEHIKKSKLAQKHLVKIDGDNILFYKKTIPQLIWDGLIYPFKILPADIANGVVTLIGKIKPFKGWAKKTLKNSMFQNIRQRSKIDAEVNSLRGLFETMSDMKDKSTNEIKSKILERSIKMFDPKTGNYDTKHERSLNRIVSGIPPAIFLANDAYNLSRMMDDDKTAASHEQKVRFKQEMARIGFNAYITLVTLGALNKSINNSKMGIMLMTALTTLVTEAFSRVINGKHITRLTPEQARAENEKNQAPEAEIKPDLSFKASENKKDDKEKAQKPLLSFDTITKALAVIIGGGFAIKGLRKIQFVESAWKNFSGYFKNIYNNLTQIKDYNISQEKFNKIVDVLEKNDFTNLAEQYRNIAQTSKNQDGTICLVAKDKKIKPLVNFFLAPFKFVWKYGTLPYTVIDDAIKSIGKKAKLVKLATNDKNIISTIINNYAKEKNIKDTKTLEYFIEQVKNKKISANMKLSPEQQEILLRLSNISSLSKSVENIGRQAEKFAKGKINEKTFQDYVKDNVLKAFNVDTMSNLSNSDLSNLAKTAALAATIWFLMTDNYNMVMLKSNGNDVEGAKTKFKERFVQEGSRLFYQTLLIDLFNSTFSKQYHQSLFGMSWITLTNTTLGEWLTRKSVGMPVGTHSRDQLLAIEEKQNNATGFLKKYYNFMKRLTGKRSIQSYQVPAKNEQQNTPQNKEINFTNNSVLRQMVKG